MQGKDEYRTCKRFEGGTIEREQKIGLIPRQIVFSNFEHLALYRSITQTECPPQGRSSSSGNVVWGGTSLYGSRFRRRISAEANVARALVGDPMNMSWRSNRSSSFSETIDASISSIVFRARAPRSARHFCLSFRIVVPSTNAAEAKPSDQLKIVEVRVNRF
jgi:hypothetical protein